jgi:hypothetical protein
MRFSISMLLLAAAGCSAPQSGWTDASAALQAHGVFTWRVDGASGADAQVVELRGAAAESVGQLSLAQASDTSTVTLAFGADQFAQTIAPAQSQMELSLDGSSATLTMTDGSWQGDAGATALLTRAKPFFELVQLIGADAQLQVLMPAAGANHKPAPGGSMPGTPTAPPTAPSPPSNMPDPPSAPPLCTTDVVTASGWAWYWEPQAEELACRRATDAVIASCNASTGLTCCNLPAAGTCTTTFNWGTGWAASIAGYLQVPATH